MNSVSPLRRVGPEEATYARQRSTCAPDLSLPKVCKEERGKEEKKSPPEKSLP